MKLKEAMKWGKDCGLTTPEECVLNIEIHAINIFSYSDIDAELQELYADYYKYYPNGNISQYREKINNKLTNTAECAEIKVTTEDVINALQHIFNEINCCAIIDAAGWTCVESHKLIDIFKNTMKQFDPAARLMSPYFDDGEDDD